MSKRNFTISVHFEKEVDEDFMIEKLRSILLDATNAGVVLVQAGLPRVVVDDEKMKKSE